MNAKTFTNLLRKSYKKHLEDEGDFKIDRDLSGQRAQVYFDEKTNRVIVAHRGTKSATDWLTNLKYLFGEKSRRFTHAKEVAERARSKYGSEAKYVHIGHSLGHILALHAADAKDKVIGYNGADHTPFLDEPENINAFNIRALGDPVSAFNKKTDLTIDTATANPIAAHDLKNLDLLPVDAVVGNGLRIDKGAFIDIHTRLFGTKRGAVKKIKELSKLMKTGVEGRELVAQVRGVLGL